MKKRRILAMLLSCTFIASCMAGCGKQETVSDGKVTISVGNWPNAEADPEGYAREMEKLEKFNKLYPNIEVITDEWSYDVKTFVAKAEGGTLPTLYTAHFTEADKIKKFGYACDITDYMKKHEVSDKINEYIMDSISYEGNIYLIPFSIYSLGIVMNLDLFEQAGLIAEDGTPDVPETFAELAETAKIIKEKTGKPGFVLPTTQNAGGWIFTSLAWNFGTKFMEQGADGKWKATFNSPECEAALQYVKDLRWKYDVLPSNTLVSNADVQKFVGSSQAAMAIAAPDVVNSLIKSYQLDKELIGFAKMPAGENGRISLMGGGFYAIEPNATEEQVDACFKWMEFNGVTPKLTEENKQTLREDMESDKENGILIGIKDISLWNGKAEVQAYRDSLIEEYRNVNPNHIKSYNDQSGVEYQAEEPVCAQELYSLLDGCVQEVLINENADCKQLLEKAASDFQQNFLDYE
ncbi:MAG: extracellular solute-binding protein [Clostridia bacterium]|nr:extracellular solute-binding protein [Clostridia bacterium]